MQHIVVATNLNATEPALGRAAALSRAMRADLRLLHVLPELMPGVIASRRHQRAQRELFHIAQRLGSETGRRVSFNVVHGDRPRWIVRESENLGAVLTVVGHTAGRPRRLLAGTALKSLRETCNAVLVVRSSSPRDEPYRTALLALDDAVGAETLMPYLRHLAPDAAIHTYRIPALGRSRSATRTAAAHVAAMRRAVDADLLAVGMPRDDSINPFSFRRILKPLAQDPECDTLIVPQDCDVEPEMTTTSIRIRSAS